MELSLANFSGSFAWSALGVAVVGVLSIVLWWLIRQKRERIWLATVRLIKDDRVPLPKLRIASPPLLSFLAFVLLVLLLIATSMKPYELVSVKQNDDQPRILVILDLSPSVSSRVSIEDYRSKVLDLLRPFLGRARVDVVYTGSSELVTLTGGDMLDAYISKLEFHRPGVKLGSLVDHYVSALDDIEKIIVVSDDDAHSWGDFNWQALQNGMGVSWYPLGPLLEGESNVFVNSVTYLSAPGNPTVEADVELMRSGSQADAIDGRIEVFVGDQRLLELGVSFPKKKDNIVVRVAWDASSVPYGSGEDERLVFKVSLDGKDLIALDNTYLNSSFGRSYQGMLVAPAFGERFLEDPSFLLQRALSVLGLKLDRFDRLDATAEQSNNYQLLLLMGGADLGINKFCPKVESRKFTSTKKVWIVPAPNLTSYEELCWCYARFALEDVASNNETPQSCRGIDTREKYIDVLNAFGAKQIGGEVGVADSSLAFRAVSKTSSWDVVGLTVPLSPKPGVGIGIARLPLVLKALLEVHGVLKSNSQYAESSDWPRIADIGSQAIEQNRASESNVPFGESALRRLLPTNLPPVWNSLNDAIYSTAGASRNQRDSSGWLSVILSVLVVCSVLEFAYMMRQIFLKPKATLLGLIFSFLILQAAGENDANAADVQLQAVAFDSLNGQSVSKLAEDIEARTSISFDAKLKLYPSMNTAAEEQGWLWVKDTKVLEERRGELNPKVAMWLRRGGFLVIEQNLSEVELKALTKGLGGLEKGEGWQVIPPDHELMRSFHLLDVLPTCQGRIWKGFQFDGRLAIVVIPFNFIETLADRPQTPNCFVKATHEQSVRAFVNLLMVVLATDYKKDQIHLPEILKRLR